MRLVTYSVGPAWLARAGVRVGHRVLDIEATSRVKGEPLPSTVKALLAAGRGALSRVQSLSKAAVTEARSFSHAMHEERAIRLLPPVPDAVRFLCAGADGPAADAPVSPRIPAGLLGHDAKVARPRGVARLDCASVLVFVVGRGGLGLKEADAMDHVAGITLLDDLRGGDRSAAPGPAPLGPEIVTMDELPDPHDLWVTCSVNGAERHRVNAADAFQRLPAMLERCARQEALEPGDLLCAGAPQAAVAGPGLEPGDVVECAIEGVATLRTVIVAPADS